MGQSTLNLFLAIATVVFAGLLVWVTGRLVTATRRLYEIQREPIVGVFLSLRDAWEPIFQIVIRNFGSGPAKNVTWEVKADQEDLRKRKAEIDPMSAVRTLPYLAPGQELRFNFGTTFNLLSESIPERAKPISVRAFYEDHRGKRYESEFVLDVEPFRDTALGATPALEKISGTLEELVRVLRQRP